MYRSLPNPFKYSQAHTSTALAVAYQDHDIRNVKALIIGPPDTPYEFGFFEVRTNQMIDTFVCLLCL
jgi:ubiquitin-protein ligase